MNHQFRVGFDLKGDRNHHEVICTRETFDPLAAWKEVMEAYKPQRIERALVLIDCVALGMNNPAPNSPLVV